MDDDAGAFAWRRRWRRRQTATAAAADPLELLRYRYARGEISRDEYVQAARELGGEPETPGDQLPAS